MMWASSMSILRLRRVVSRKFCSGASSEWEWAGRPNLILQPCVAQGKVEYKFYSPLTKGFMNCVGSGGEEELNVMKNKRNDGVGSSQGWVFMFEDGGSYNMCLLNPLSGRRIQLPPFFDTDNKRNWPYKLILSHSPDEEECRAVMILGSRDRAAFCSPGRSDTWSPLGPIRPINSYADVAYCGPRKAFVSASLRWPTWGVSISEDVEFWDLKSPSTSATPVKTVSAPRHRYGFWTLASSALRRSSGPQLRYQWLTFLVSEEESGEVFMVRRYLDFDSERIDYKVFRITATATHDDVIVHPCESLDGLVMFIGMNHSFAVKASRYPEFKPNAIYFCCRDWPVEKQRADTFFYDHTKAYSAGFDFSPDQRFLFRSNRPPMFFNSRVVGDCPSSSS